MHVLCTRAHVDTRRARDNKIREGGEKKNEKPKAEPRAQGDTLDDSFGVYARSTPMPMPMTPVACRSGVNVVVRTVSLPLPPVAHAEGGLDFNFRFSICQNHRPLAPSWWWAAADERRTSRLFARAPHAVRTAKNWTVERPNETATKRADYQPPLTRLTRREPT